MVALELSRDHFEARLLSMRARGALSADLIVLEGTDAVGKATQSKLLAEKLGGTRFSFPNYESTTGQAILGHLKKQWSAHLDDERLNALVFQCLQTVNRLELVPEIKKALLRGPVVMDRYWVSAVVYGSLDGLDPEWLRTTQEKPMPHADVQILIDVPVEEGFKRRPERRDRYETDRLFLEKVRHEYLQVFGSDNSLKKKVCQTKPGWWVVDGTGTIEETHALILSCLT